MKDLNFNCLVIETTDRCNAKCAMCYQAAGPRGSDIRGDYKLSLQTTRRVIDEAVTLDNLGNRIHIAGGESFLNYDEVVQIFRHAKLRGFRHIGAVTNAFWAKDDVTALSKCHELASVGATYLEVSVDYWHLPYVSLERVRCLLRAARVSGLGLVLRTLTSRNHHLPELLSSFSAAELVDVKIGTSLYQPVGRGADEIDDTEVYYVAAPNGCCEDILNLTIAPNGGVFPCCAGSEMTESLVLGNVNTNSLKDIMFRARTDYMVRSLIHRGPVELEELIKQLGLGDRLQPKHTSICHLCWDIFKDPVLSAALRDHFNELHIAALMKIASDAMSERASS